MKLFYFTLFLFFALLSLSASPYFEVERLQFQLDSLPKEEKAKYLNNIAISCKRESNADFLKYSRMALEYAAKYQNKKEEAFALNSIGSAFRYQDQYDSAQIYYMKALDQYKELQDSAGLIEVYNRLGILYWYLQDPHWSLDAYQKSLDLCNKTTDREGEANCYNNIGLLYLDMVGKRDSALIFFQKGEAIYKEINNDNGLATTLNNIGLIYRDKHQYRIALPYFSGAVKLYQKINNSWGYVNSLINVGKSLYGLGYLNKSADTLQKANTLATLNNFPKLRLEILEFYTHAANCEKKFKEAYLWHIDYVALKDSILNSEKHQQIIELETRYKTKLKEEEILLLQKQKELEQAKARQTRIGLIILCAVSIIALLVVIIIFMRYKNRQKEAQQKIAREKTEIENAMLRSQMNPHFIFNALNSIQMFVLDNQAENAAVFLSKFARLMRQTLNSSSKEWITLKEEIEILSLYTELELQRSNNNFSFTIECNIKKTNEIFVPPMLIQPFIENAILHGLSSQKKFGELKLCITPVRPNCLKCTITDNGIGRTASAQEQCIKKEESKGMMLTRRRLNLFETEKKQIFGFTITDLYTSEKKATGTKIELFIPFEDE